MLDNPPIEHLCKHLRENHDEDWMFEFVEYDGIALNCYLPTDSKDTFVIINASHYDILEVGSKVPQGLIDEITLTLEDGLRIYVGWEGTEMPDKWA